MPSKKQVISQTRNKVGAKQNKKTKKDRVKTQSGYGGQLSTIEFINVGLLKDKIEELQHLIHNLLEQENRGLSLVVKVEQNKKSLTYYLTEKSITLSIAHHVEQSFRHFHPAVKIRNPKDNLFYTITVTFE